MGEKGIRIVEGKVEEIMLELYRNKRRYRTEVLRTDLSLMVSFS
jgi:hypothetical protein